MNNNRTPAHLALALADARANNYALGVKLVRGAYHPYEIAAHRTATGYGNSAIATASPSSSISPDIEPPVWMEKRETDEAFNGCLKVLIKAVKDDVKRCEKATRHTFIERNIEVAKNGWFGLFSGGGAGGTDIKANEREAEVDKKPKTMTTLPPSICVLFATHNWTSCGLVLQNLVDAGLAVTSDGQAFKPGGEPTGVVEINDAAVERIAIGQLYGAFVSNLIPLFVHYFQKGMCDDLTDWVVKNTVSVAPIVIK
jgi:proline dehydrogenase